MHVPIKVNKAQVWQQSAGLSMFFFFRSGNVCGPWFVFVKVCEFDKTENEGTPSTDCRHVSGVSKHQSVKWSLNTLNHKFWSCVSTSTAGIGASINIYAALIKNRHIRMIKNLQTKHKPYSAMLSKLYNSYLLPSSLSSFIYLTAIQPLPLWHSEA